jgi:hypothetical protein
MGATLLNLELFMFKVILPSPAFAVETLTLEPEISSLR